jgi:hypothetical protein
MGEVNAASTGLEEITSGLQTAAKPRAADARTLREQTVALSPSGIRQPGQWVEYTGGLTTRVTRAMKPGTTTAGENRNRRRQAQRLPESR